MRLAKVALIGALVSVVAACGSTQLLTGARHGDPVDPGAKPAARDCGQAIRADTAAATRIRIELRIDGLAATDAAVVAAANDPQADVSTLGIPATQAELAAVKASGLFLDPTMPITSWVHIGATERFGGVWIDPPGTDQFVVSIVGSDPRTLALARCVEPPKIRYVHAARSLADGLALQQRITNDWQLLRASGIEVTMTSYSETEGIVELGVSRVSDEIAALVRDRYGEAVRVVQADAAHDT